MSETEKKCIGGAKRTQRTQRKNKQRKQNKKPRSMNKINSLETRVRSMVYDYFTFDEYLEKMETGDGELYALLFVQKMRMGFSPSDEVIEHIMRTQNQNTTVIREYLTNCYLKYTSLSRYY